jgi:ABC-type branched-subunit amino acid transport system ATPase component
MGPTMTLQIETRNLVKRFGGVTALGGVSVAVDAGELVGLIGPNGSGKTTFLNILSGFYTPDEGSIRFQGVRIDGRQPADIAVSGIARSFQVTKIFRRISVLDNLLVAGLTDWSVSRTQATTRGREVLERLELGTLADEAAANLSGGQSKLLEFGRIMMLKPKVVLLDEPFGGVHPDLKRFMHDTVRAWNAQGTTVILISHDMGSIFDLCRRVIVLHDGLVVANESAETVRSNPVVLAAYLGTQTSGEAS